MELTLLTFCLIGTDDLSFDYPNFVATTKRPVEVPARLLGAFKCLLYLAGFDDCTLKGRRGHFTFAMTDQAAPERLLGISSLSTAENAFMKLRYFNERTLKQSHHASVRALKPFEAHGSNAATDESVFEFGIDLLGLDEVTDQQQRFYPAWHLRHLIEAKLVSLRDHRLSGVTTVHTSSPLSVFDVILRPVTRSGVKVKVTTHYEVRLRFSYNLESREHTGQRLTGQFDLLKPGAVIPEPELAAHRARRAAPATAPPRVPRARAPRPPPAPPPPHHIATTVGAPIPLDEIVRRVVCAMEFQVPAGLFYFKGAVDGPPRGGYVWVRFLDGARLLVACDRVLRVME